MISWSFWSISAFVKPIICPISDKYFQCRCIRDWIPLRLPLGADSTVNFDAAAAFERTPVIIFKSVWFAGAFFDYPVAFAFADRRNWLAHKSLYDTVSYSSKAALLWIARDCCVKLMDFRGGPGTLTTKNFSVPFIPPKAHPKEVRAESVVDFRPVLKAAVWIPKKLMTLYPYCRTMGRLRKSLCIPEQCKKADWGLEHRVRILQNVPIWNRRTHIRICITTLIIWRSRLSCIEAVIHVKPVRNIIRQSFIVKDLDKFDCRIKPI